jgi:REP element-mobilizing transposase RayT
MPRGPRLDAPGVAHHVRLRGIARRLIFLCDDDRYDFVARLDRLLCELGFLCLAWALMGNHAHLVLRTGDAPLSLLMQRLCTGYALAFNRRHGRIGHLFHNRFLSSVIEDDAHLRAAVAYVHRNPVDASLTTLAGLADYAWCGHGALVGARMPQAFEAVAEALALFGGDPAAVSAAVAERPHVPAPREWKRTPLRALRPLAAAAPPPASFAAIVAELAAASGVPAGEILARSKRPAVVRARDQVAARAVRELGESLTHVARRLGVTQPAVSLMLQRVRRAQARRDARPGHETYELMERPRVF